MIHVHLVAIEIVQLMMLENQPWDGHRHQTCVASSRKRDRQTTLQESTNDRNKHNDSTNDDSIEIGVIRAKFNDSKGCEHWVAQYPKTTGRSGKRYTMARKCSSCGKNTWCFCLQCNLPFCYPINNHGSAMPMEEIVSSINTFKT